MTFTRTCPAQESAISTFASAALDRWHFYFAIAMVLVATMCVWYNPTALPISAEYTPVFRPSVFTLAVSLLAFCFGVLC